MTRPTVMVFCGGFLRARGGALTTFDVPGTSNASPIGINNGGVITGTYSDPSGNFHSFVRDPNGTITSFDPASFTAMSGIPGIINPAGAITGYFSSFAVGTPHSGASSGVSKER